MNDVNAKGGKKPGAAGSDRLADLNVALMGVENDLQGRALGRARSEADWAYGVVNKAAEAGVIDIQCGDGEEEGGERDSTFDVNNDVPHADSDSGEEGTHEEGDVSS